MASTYVELLLKLGDYFRDTFFAWTFKKLNEKIAAFFLEKSQRKTTTSQPLDTCLVEDVSPVYVEKLLCILHAISFLMLMGQNGVAHNVVM